MRTIKRERLLYKESRYLRKLYLYTGNYLYYLTLTLTLHSTYCCPLSSIQFSKRNKKKKKEIKQNLKFATFLLDPVQKLSIVNKRRIKKEKQKQKTG